MATQASACLRALAVVALAVLPTVVQAQSDPPHWTGASAIIDCTSQCHTVHNSVNLTQSESNVNLCQTCHVGSGLASDLAIYSADVAVPGVGGIHHAFDACAENATLETQLPNDAQRVLRVMEGDAGCVNGYVVCSTCHNQHKGEAQFGGASRVSPAKVVANDAGTTGIVNSGGSFTGAEGVWYLIEIVQSCGETAARFRYSKDNSLSWIPTLCTTGNLGPCKTANGSTAVPLNDMVEEGVEVTFSPGSYTQDDQWEFSASWNFVRRNLPLNRSPEVLLDTGDNTTGDDFCRDCHRSWVMTHTDVETWDGSNKSHPIGVTLDANGQGYDRSVPLDGNGADQGSGGADLNPTNDLVFDSSNFVQCLSCHAAHFADSNTQTVDGP